MFLIRSSNCDGCAYEGSDKVERVHQSRSCVGGMEQIEANEISCTEVSNKIENEGSKTVSGQEKSLFVRSKGTSD